MFEKLSIFLIKPGKEGKEARRLQGYKSRNWEDRLIIYVDKNEGKVYCTNIPGIVHSLCYEIQKFVWQMSALRSPGDRHILLIPFCCVHLLISPAGEGKNVKT